MNSRRKTNCFGPRSCGGRRSTIISWIATIRPIPSRPSTARRFPGGVSTVAPFDFDHYSPDEARRRLTIVYRLVFPFPAEMKPSAGHLPRRAPAASPPGARWEDASRARPVSLLTRGAARGTDPAENEDVHWMRVALADAERGRGWVEPNPLVGAVVIAGRPAVGVGHHERFGGPHAEVVALARAGRGRRRDALCHARALLPPRQDPPCTDAILAAGIARVVAAMRDPFPEVNGQGLAALEAAGLAVEVGCEADAARRSTPRT